MKTIEELKQQTPVYLHNWKDKIDLVSDFEEDLYMTSSDFYAETATYPNMEAWEKSKEKMRQALGKYEDINILFASYGEDNYSGEAWVLFEQDGKLFEVNGSHCSCYGLEGQWKPEETALEAIQMRLEKGYLGHDNYSGNEFAAELKEFLK